MHENNSERGSFHIVFVPKGTEPTPRPDLIRTSKTSWWWPHSYRPTVFDDDDVMCINPIKGELISYSREDVLQQAIKTHSHLHYGDIRRDTWILDQDGNVIVVISFNVVVNRLEQ